MPSYSRLSRTALLSVATPLVLSARRNRTEDLVLSAADAAELARLELEASLRGRRVAGVELSAAAAAAMAAEDSLDRRVVALSRALSGMADLGDGESEQVRDQLFPKGAGELVRRTGRAQVPEYTMLTDGLAALAEHPALVRLAPYPGALRADLLGFIDALGDKDGTRDGATGAVRGLVEAADGLRVALQHLDRTVELVSGGLNSEGYALWAGAARGLG